MRTSRVRPLVIALLLAGGLQGLQASPAVAQVRLPILPKPPPPKVVPPVAAPAISDPTVPVRGTMIMVHAGGWAGHDEYEQDKLVTRPGQQLLALGWRIVSIDYEEGTAGLQDVLNTAGSELTRGTSSGPVCIYGESAGGHLALIAASRLPAVDCVIALGAPTNLGLYHQEAAASADGRLKLVDYQAARFFGTTEADNAPWNPASLAPKIHGDVMLMREADDPVVSPVHNQRFKSNRVTAQTVELSAGTSTETFVHGTVSEAGRAAYSTAIATFADRAVAGHAAERRAARTGCRGSRRTLRELSLSRLHSALRCLARKDRSVPGRSGGWRRTTFRLTGELNAARVWDKLRSTQSGRRALAATGSGHSRLTVRTAEQSRVILSKR